MTHEKLMSTLSNVVEKHSTIDEKMVKKEIKIEINSEELDYEEIDLNNSPKDNIYMEELIINDINLQQLNDIIDNKVIEENQMINNINDETDDDEFDTKMDLSDNKNENNCPDVKCNLCEKQEKTTILNKNVFNQHIRSDHLGEKNVDGFYQCQFCNKSRLYLYEGIIKHLRRVHLKLDVAKKGSCNICGTEFFSKQNLQRHIDIVHLKLKPFICSICNFSFGQLCQLNAHFAIHENKRNFKCKQCSRSYNNLFALRKHKIIHLPMDERKIAKYKRNYLKKVVCEVCGISVVNYKQHIDLHENRKPYKCDYCPKQFRIKNSLKLHLFTHTKERPYKCDQCNKSFRQSSHLLIHSKTHTGAKPHVCSYCNKKFTTYGNFSEHIRRIHTYEQPYKCRFCPNTIFSNLKETKQHLKNFHSDFDANQTDADGNKIFGYIYNGTRII